MTLALRGAVCIAYLAFVAWLAWTSAMSDRGSGSAGLTVLFFLVWTVSSALVGRWLGKAGLALPAGAILGVVAVGEILGVGAFDNELRVVNWVIEATFSAAFIGLGAWPGDRRDRRRVRSAPARRRSGRSPRP